MDQLKSILRRTRASEERKPIAPRMRVGYNPANDKAEEAIRNSQQSTSRLSIQERGP